jgi:hypothetical protein
MIRRVPPHSRAPRLTWTRCMNEAVCIAPAIIIAIFLGSMEPAEAYATSIMKRLPSDIAGVDLVVSCDSHSTDLDYLAQTASGVPLDDPYAIARGANQGLVNLMNLGGKQARSYIVPHALIRAVVRIEYKMDVLDRVDLILWSSRMTLVHTFETNAGLFIVSDVYELPYDGRGKPDEQILSRHRRLLRLLDLGLSFYRSSQGKCGSSPPPARASDKKPQTTAPPSRGQSDLE